MRAKSLWSCPILCNLMYCSPPGSSVHGISQARILEWDAMPSSWGLFLTQGCNLHLLGLPHWLVGSFTTKFVPFTKLIILEPIYICNPSLKCKKLSRLLSCKVRELEKARFRKRRPALYRNRSPLMRREGAAVRLVSSCTNPRKE